MDRNIFINYTIDNESRSLSARRAWIEISICLGSWILPPVALRKESVDRNPVRSARHVLARKVALRKESVDRNLDNRVTLVPHQVALRKESVDRNVAAYVAVVSLKQSLSARRAWIEIRVYIMTTIICTGRSPQGERG